MDGSILNDIKKLLGIDADDTDYDTDIIIDINSAFAKLCQLGVGPKSGYGITSASDRWSDFMSVSIEGCPLALVKTYMVAQVRIYFDPPVSSAAYTSLENIVKEHEFRLGVLCDN